MRLFSSSLMPDEATARMDWFIRLRWFAAAVLLAFVAVGRILLRLQFAIAPFVLIAFFIALYNAGFLLLARGARREGKWSNRLASM